jgi:hypothetical protein
MLMFCKNLETISAQFERAPWFENITLWFKANANNAFCWVKWMEMLLVCPYTDTDYWILISAEWLMNIDHTLHAVCIYVTACLYMRHAQTHICVPVRMCSQRPVKAEILWKKKVKSPYFFSTKFHALSNGVFGFPVSRVRWAENGG